MKSTIKFTWKTWLLLAGTVATAGLIFYFSSCDGTKSSAQSDFVLHLFRFLEELPGGSFLVRKGAHFSIYFLLGLLSCAFFRSMNFPLSRSLFFAVILSCLYAMTDEFHQTFVPGRAGEFRDVCLDTFGAFIGALIVIALAKLIERKLDNPSTQKKNSGLS